MAEAQERIAQNVKLPPGYRIEWAGEFGALKDAQERLMYIVPLSLLLILMAAVGRQWLNRIRLALGSRFLTGAMCGYVLGTTRVLPATAMNPRTGALGPNARSGPDLA